MDQHSDQPSSQGEAEQGGSASHIPRTPERCPHREAVGTGAQNLDRADRLLREEGIPTPPKAPHRCRLLAEIIGLGETDDSVVDWRTCVTCCERFEPSLERINTTIASALYGKLREIIKKGG